MVNRSKLSLVAVIAALLVAQPLTSAMAGPTIVVKIGDGLTIQSTPDEPFVDAELATGDDPGFAESADELVDDSDIATAGEIHAAVDPGDAAERELVLEVLTCDQSKKLLRDAGYRKIRRQHCGDLQHLYRAKKNGRKYRLAVNAATRAISRF